MEKMRDVNAVLKEGKELPKVSVCVPIYNMERFIGRCAESLMQQTYHNLEFVFVNDCSSDKSMDGLLEVIDGYPHRKDQITIKNLPQNKGLANARNVAVENTTGVFVIHVDSDDWIDKVAIELLVAKQQETNAEIVFGNFSRHYPNGEKKGIAEEFVFHR